MIIMVNGLVYDIRRLVRKFRGHRGENLVSFSGDISLQKDYETTRG